MDDADADISTEVTSSEITPSPEGGAGSAGAGAGNAGASPPAARPDYLLEGYQDAEAQARAFQQFSQQYGGHQNAQQQLEWARQVQHRYENDPAYKAEWDRVHGINQDQNQQPQLPKGLEFLQAADDPAMLAAYQIALQNGGQLPQGYQNRDAAMKAFQQHQGWWDNFFLSPHKGIEQLLEHPAIQQKIAQLAGKQVQPVQEQLRQQTGQQLVEKYGERLGQMHPSILGLYKQGRYGGGAQGAEAALKDDAAFKAALAGGQPGGKAPAAPQPPAAPKKPGGGPGAKMDAADQGRRTREESQRDIARESARQMARAKVGMLNGKD